MIDGKTIAAIAAAGAVATGAGVIGTDAGREGMQKFTGGIEQAIHGMASDAGKPEIEKRILDPNVIVIDNRPVADYYADIHKNGCSNAALGRPSVDDTSNGKSSDCKSAAARPADITAP